MPDVIIVQVWHGKASRIVGVFPCDLDPEEIRKYGEFWKQVLEGSEWTKETWSIRERAVYGQNDPPVSSGQ